MLMHGVSLLRDIANIKESHRHLEALNCSYDSNISHRVSKNITFIVVIREVILVCSKLGRPRVYCHIEGAANEELFCGYKRWTSLFLDPIEL
jgi:hypothetical protein